MKKMIALLLVCVLAASFAGCGEEASKTDGSNSVAQTVVDDNNILEVLEGTNDFDALMEKYGKITVSATDRSGGEYTIHLNKKDDDFSYYLTDATGVEYAVTTKGQYIVTSDGDSEALLFTSDEDYEAMREGAIESIRSGMYQYNQEEKLVNVEEADGKTTVTSVIHMTDEVEGYIEFKSAWGIEDEEFDFFNVYVLDSTTLEILETSTYCELSTGRVDSGLMTIQYGQDYTISDALKACMENAQ